jgi:hypothetical protein
MDELSALFGKLFSSAAFDFMQHALNVILKIKTTCNKCFSDFPYEAMMDSNILVDFIIVPTCKR